MYHTDSASCSTNVVICMEYLRAITNRLVSENQHDLLPLSTSFSNCTCPYHVCLSLRKSPCSSPFAFFNYAVTPDVTSHHTPPCFEGVGPLSEGHVLAPHQHRDGSIHPGTGALHCLYNGKSKGFGGFRVLV